MRSSRPGDVLSFNQVNGVPAGLAAPSPPGFRYVEVWPPNLGWRPLEGLLSRSAGHAARQGDTLAIYPPVWNSGRSAALRTVVLTQAIATVLGAGTLMYGDAVGVLREPYYPDHERLRGDEPREVLAWNRFALRCRDLFTDGEDTTWYEIGLIDLTGSTSGSWQSGTDAGSCREAAVTMLVDEPERWRADAAILGTADGRFRAVELTRQRHREGVAVTVTVPVLAGWTVVRFSHA